MDLFSKAVDFAKGLVSSPSTRQWVAARLFYQNLTQKTDILNPEKTQTELIAALEYLIKLGWHICATAVRSDHHFDGSGNGYHGAGAAIDFWPYTDGTNKVWVDASTKIFQSFLYDCANAPHRMQIGLGGSAYSEANVAATKLSLNTAAVFHDDIEDHVHLGVTFK